jgi:hypothetical protein
MLQAFSYNVFQFSLRPYLPSLLGEGLGKGASNIKHFLHLAPQNLHFVP